MVHIDADLAPDVGSILTGAIHAWSEHLWRIEDSRTGGTDAPDGHHLHHWSDGSPTNLANLALLCSTHHHIVHEDRWSLTRAPDGTLDFTTPTGSKLEARVGNSREDPP
jgi:hypothetical protein